MRLIFLHWRPIKVENIRKSHLRSELSSWWFWYDHHPHNICKSSYENQVFYCLKWNNELFCWSPALSFSPEKGLQVLIWNHPFLFKNTVIISPIWKKEPAAPLNPQISLFWEIFCLEMFSSITLIRYSDDHKSFFFFFPQMPHVKEARVSFPQIVKFFLSPYVIFNEIPVFVYDLFIFIKKAIMIPKMSYKSMEHRRQ